MLLSLSSKMAGVKRSPTENIRNTANLTIFYKMDKYAIGAVTS